jgi:hypothetical protein
MNTEQGDLMSRETLAVKYSCSLPLSSLPAHRESYYVLCSELSLDAASSVYSEREIRPTA